MAAIVSSPGAWRTLPLLSGESDSKILVGSVMAVRSSLTGHGRPSAGARRKSPRVTARGRVTWGHLGALRRPLVKRAAAISCEKKSPRSPFRREPENGSIPPQGIGSSRVLGVADAATAQAKDDADPLERIDLKPGTRPEGRAHAHAREYVVVRRTLIGSAL